MHPFTVNYSFVLRVQEGAACNSYFVLYALLGPNTYASNT